jgi:hypothetical protein
VSPAEVEAGHTVPRHPFRQWILPPIEKGQGDRFHLAARGPLDHFHPCVSRMCTLRLIVLFSPVRASMRF